jgi:uncharacterized protein
MTKTLLASLIALTACHDTKVIMPNGPATPPGQMTITGTATLDVTPDCADLTMTVTADDLKPGAATAAAEAKENAVIAALEKAGVAEADLELSLLELAPLYDPETGGWGQLHVHTYRASITITATTHDFAQIASLMDAGADAGASQLSSRFRRSDLATLKLKVRDMALTAAKQKAAQTAKGLGIPLGRIVSVSENTGGQMWANEYFPAAAARSGIGGSMEPLTLDVTIGYELTKET